MNKLLYQKPDTLIVRVEVQAMLAGSGIDGGTTQSDEETNGIGAATIGTKTVSGVSWNKNDNDSDESSWNW